MKVAVLGLGSAGARHARILRELGHDVVGFDPEAGPPEGVAIASSQEEAIEAGDWVLVATPNALHAVQASAAIEAGRPTLVEKPLAVTAADARSVAVLADSSGVLCGVAMNLRFHPGVLALRRLVDDGTLGRVRYARASFGWDLRRWRPTTDYRESYSARDDLGGGIVLDAIHELDYLTWLMGPVEAIVAQAGRLSDLEIDVEDTAAAVLRFESGALGVFEANFHEPAYRRGCLLVGSEATAQWDWTTATVTVRAADRPDRAEDASAEPEDGYRAELEDFAAAVVEDRPPRTTAREGADAVALAEAIKQAAAH